MILEKDNPDLFLTDHLELHFLELIKLKDETENPSLLIKWMMFFKYGGIEEEKMKFVLKNDLIMQKAYEEYKKFTQDEELREKYETREKWMKDRNSFIYEARMEALVEGKIEGKIEDAKKMLIRGFSIEDIVEITGLTQDEIKKYCE